MTAAKSLKAPPTTNTADFEPLHSRQRPTPSNRGHRRGTQNPGDSGNARDKPQHKTCISCGKEPHPRDKCPARDATCNRCNKKGHYAAHCLTKQKQAAAIESEIDAVFLGQVESQQKPLWLATLNLNGHSLQFKLDTSAEVTAISEDAYKTLQNPQTSSSTKVLYGPSQQPLHCIGQFPGKFSHKGTAATQPVFVIRGLKSNLLGLPAITALRLAIQLDTTETTEDYLKQFPSLFEGLGNLVQPFEIHLKDGATPHCSLVRLVPLACAGA